MSCVCECILCVWVYGGCDWMLCVSGSVWVVWTVYCTCVGSYADCRGH